MKNQLSTVLNKEVSRKEFLGISGLALISLFGFGTIVKMLTGHSLDSSFKQQASGYGSNAYGGSAGKAK